MEITHEFGYKNNPDSQAFIESHHSTLEREFVQLNSFERTEKMLSMLTTLICFYIITMVTRFFKLYDTKCIRQDVL